MDEITLALNRLNWRIEILQHIAANAYLTAFSLFEVLQSSPQSLPQSDLRILAAKILRRLENELEEQQREAYEKFFSDPSIPEGERALVAEEYAHVVEQVKSSLIPSWRVESQKPSVSREISIKRAKKRKKKGG
jgi:hypothetical protein